MTITIDQQAIRILVDSYPGMGNGMACARQLIKCACLISKIILVYNG